MLGGFPETLGQLQSLTVLDISGTDSADCPLKRGIALPESISDLSSLRDLRIALPTLSGTIPDDFGRLSLLRTLHLQVIPSNYTYSVLNSYLPSSLGNLSNLETIRFIDTALLGFDSSKGVAFPNLIEISLQGSRYYHNDMTELLLSAPKLEIVDFSFTSILLNFRVFDYLSKISSIILDNTRLGERLSTLLDANHPNLKHLSARNCILRGPVTIDPENLKSLEYLDLSGNLLVGTIPAALSLLPLKKLVIFHTPNLFFPDELGPLNATLVHLDLRGLVGHGMELPASIGALHKLSFLSLQSCGLTGMIPAGLGQALDLESVYLADNDFHGTIPDFWTTKKEFVFDAHDNRLTGSIPASLASRASSLLLHNNQLSGDIAPDLFSTNGDLVEIVLAHNRFTGPLPIFHNASSLSTIDLSFNSFNGEIPTAYGSTRTLRLSSNLLSGPLHPLLQPFCGNLSLLALDQNQFVGTFPSVLDCYHLQELTISNNGFTGALPLLPDEISTFDASNNRFDSNKMSRWLATPAFRSLKMLDLSHNKMIILTPLTHLIGPQMIYLAVADNRVSGVSGVLADEPFTALRTLDVSNSALTGTFPAELFPSLNVLKLTNNMLSGELDLRWFPSISQLEISDNEFNFEVSQFSSIPSLANVDASRNFIHGALSLASLPNLQTFNLSNNQLNLKPDFNSIGLLFANASLKVLDISSNILPIFTSLDTNKTGLARTSASSRSINLPKAVTCYDLSFYGKGAGSFVYEESMFSYLQCDCDQAHFGAPPTLCLRCPTGSETWCGATEASVSDNSYAFFINMTDTHIKGSSTSAFGSLSFASDLASLLWPSVADSDTGSLLYGGDPDPTTDLSGIQLVNESCLVTPVQTLGHRSNCKGALLNASEIQRVNGSLHKLLEGQCNQGSEGRLCSKCTCKSTADCWYLRGFYCAKCSHVFSTAASASLLLGVIALLIIAIGVISAIIIRRRRLPSLTPFAQLSFAKLKRCLGLERWRVRLALG